MKLRFLLRTTAVLLFLACYDSQNLKAIYSAEEVGTYSLIVVKEDGKDVLYRLNSKTGQVWEYSERFIISPEQIAKNDEQKKTVSMILEKAKETGKNVYTQPYWASTAEDASIDYLSLR